MTSSLAADSSTNIAYLWLLALGFPENEAAACLAPELFTKEPSQLDRERRPRMKATRLT